MKVSILVILSVVMITLSCNKNNNGNVSKKPVAKFTIFGYENVTPSTISFINTSSNATSYEWNFGDGSTSTEFNPTHTYTFAGSFLLKLKVTGPEGTDLVCKLVAIESAPPSNKSAFSYFQDKCDGTPVAMAFKTINPLSTNTVWNFGSGPNIIDRDPITQFLIPGDYTIKYSTVINGVRDTVTRIIMIN